jgi:hypothetical protein
MSQSGRTLVVAMLLVASIQGCGTPSLLEEETLDQRAQELRAKDKLTANKQSDNGLSTNGLSTNGLSTNGLSTNGLSTNGLQSSTFSSWFSADPALRDNLMKYLILCAVPNGEVRTHTSPDTGVTYTWYGKLGLAPRWASGEAATEVEEQVISACLAAHTNPYGEKVDFSILGRDAEGVEIPYTWQELQVFNVREACFFGNLFREQGLYAGNDHTQLGASQSTVRGCGLSSVDNGTNPVCTVINRVGTCGDSAQQCVLDVTGKYYTQCTYNGVSYRPITTRIQTAIIYTCGDGICQVSEKCGQGWTPDNCSDCGACQ